MIKNDLPMVKNCQDPLNDGHEHPRTTQHDDQDDFAILIRRSKRSKTAQHNR